jgi:ferredoxin-nitrite reductase
VVACTGSEFCRYAVVETKERAVKWARWMDDQLAEGGALGGAANGPGPHAHAVPVTVSGQRGPDGRSVRGEDAGVIRMHFSGCPASCAQPQVADIGFRGDIAHVEEHIEEAVDIGLGGSLGPDAEFIDWVVGAMPVEEVPDALVRVVRRYRDERREGEPFHNWARRIPNEELHQVLAGLP